MTHLVIHAHRSAASMPTPSHRAVAPRTVAAVLALLAALVTVRGLEIALNPTPAPGVRAPAQSSPSTAPGFDS